MSRPHVLINVASSVDGKIDTRERHGAAISSAADRDRVDRLRASVDAVMVGGRTLHDEDPRLTVKSEVLRAERLARGLAEQPLKVAVGSVRLGPRQGGRFLSGGRAVVFVPRGGGSDWLAPAGVHVYELGEGRVDLAAALAKLAELGVERLLVEGGGTLNFDLLRLGLVDEVLVFVAPLVFGGGGAPTLADGDGLSRETAVALQRAEVQIWPDGGVLLRYKVEPS